MLIDIFYEKRDKIKAREELLERKVEEEKALESTQDPCLETPDAVKEIRW